LLLEPTFSEHTFKMYRDVLKGIKAGWKKPVNHDSGSEDSKSSLSSWCDGWTNMDYVNAERNFDKISLDDLKNTFKILQKRCPRSWNPKLEARAWDFHDKIWMLRRRPGSVY